jgi:hypothetical protein
MSYKDMCHRCGGTGRYRWFAQGQVADGMCFACMGRGHRLFLTSPEVRAKNRAKAQAKRDAQRAEREASRVESAYRGHYTLYLYSLARASREALKPPRSPAPIGRVEVAGTVISTRVDQHHAYGTQYKALVEDDRGFRVWGNLPYSMHNAKKGDRVSFRARFKRSPDDEFFAFWQRAHPLTWNGYEL